MSDSVSKRLADVAEKFLKVAEGTSDTRTAQRALNVVDTALQLSIKLKALAIEDYAMMFLSFLTGKHKRSLVWDSYCTFCDVNNYPKLRKGEFSDFYKRVGFESSISGGEHYIKPPANWTPVLSEQREYATPPLVPETRIERRRAIQHQS